MSRFMKLRREEFIAQFAIPFHVHCLKVKASIGAPVFGGSVLL